MIVDDTKLELKSKINVYKNYIFGTKRKNPRQVISQDVKKKIKKHHLSEYWNYSDKEAGGNALRYGKPPFRVKLYVASDGYLLTIQDSGTGFNVPQVLQRMNNNQKYWRNKGTGFQYFTSDKVTVSFENHGRNINLLKHHQTKGKTKPCNAVGVVGKSAPPQNKGTNAKEIASRREPSPLRKKYERKLRRTRCQVSSRREKKKKRTYVEDLPTFPDLAFPPTDDRGTIKHSTLSDQTKKHTCPHCGEQLNKSLKRNFPEK